MQKLHEDVASSSLEYEGKIRSSHSDQGIVSACVGGQVQVVAVGGVEV